MSNANLGIGPKTLLAAAQNLTTAWVNLGAQLDTRGVRAVALYLTVDINDGANVRVRAMAAHALAGTEHTLAIKTVAASAIAIEAEYLEFNVDTDQDMMITWDIAGVVPYTQFQVQAGTAGATAAQIDAASVVMSY